MRLKSTLAFLVLGSLASFRAMANQVTFDMPTSTDNSAETIDATAVVTTLDNGIVTVLLTNLTAANLMKSAGQTLSDFTFTLNGITAAVTKTANEDAPTGTSLFLTASANTVQKWGFSNIGGNTYKLDDLNGGDSPRSTIIGGTAGEAASDYSIANSSLTGNHNPFYQGSALFTLHITGVDHNTTLGDSAIFSFGTAACGTGENDGKCVTGSITPTPEPRSTAFLLIAGAIMAFAFRRRNASAKA